MARERGDDGRDVVGRQHARGAERFGPRDAAGDIVFEERAIEAERDAEVERRRIRSGIEATGPQRHACSPQGVTIRGLKTVALTIGEPEADVGGGVAARRRTRRSAARWPPARRR